MRKIVRGTPEDELQKYWHCGKSKAEKGMLYEQYIGYLYEEAGYEVEYVGIDRGSYDIGIDLICHYEDKDKHTNQRVFIIQCKNWKDDGSVVGIKDIVYFYGAIHYYAKLESIEDFIGVFYTATRFSYSAIVAAKCLNIDIHDNYPMLEPFPIIKCKYSNKEYYLPCDWNYRTMRLRLSEGDCYCQTIVEAEKKGFHRAYKAYI